MSESEELWKVVKNLGKPLVDSIWPKYEYLGSKFRNLGSMDASHLLPYPYIMRSYPRRDIPLMYVTLTIRPIVYLVGAFGMIYIRYHQNRLTRDLTFTLKEWVCFDTDGIATTGRWPDWVCWAWADRKAFGILAWRSLLVGLHAGLVNCISAFLYNLILLKEPPVSVPVAMTIAFFTMNDPEGRLFFIYRPWAHVIIVTGLFDIMRVTVLNLGTTRYVYNWFLQLAAENMAFVIWPPSWLLF